MAVRRSRTLPGHRGGNRRRTAGLGQQRPPASPPGTPSRLRPKLGWSAVISRQEWAIYRLAIETLRAAGIRFMLGGGFALATFTGRWRSTKDIDLYIRPQDRDSAVAALAGAGFGDYYPRLAYDRRWIYRSVRSDMIVDLIWAMANQRAQVDETWLDRADEVFLRGQHLPVLPPEELIWCKLYILQRDRCDWSDLFNLLYAAGPQIDWQHLLQRLQDDAPLLQALLLVYDWLCPARARLLPGSLWHRLRLPPPATPSRRPPRDRIRLLDSRRWFAATTAPGDRLEI